MTQRQRGVTVTLDVASRMTSCHDAGPPARPTGSVVMIPLPCREPYIPLPCRTYFRHLPLPYEEEKITLFKAMDIWTLEERRNRQDLIEVFKTCKVLSRLKVNELFPLDDDVKGNRRHSWKNFGAHGTVACIFLMEYY